MRHDRVRAENSAASMVAYTGSDDASEAVAEGEGAGLAMPPSSRLRRLCDAAPDAVAAGAGAAVGTAAAIAPVPDGREPTRSCSGAAKPA
jgi:hypothetical protein